MTGEGRLVRDCMIEKINRVQPYIRPVRDRAELVSLLQDKLMEEVAEVMRVIADRGDPLEELGDVLQVVIDLGSCYGYDMGMINDASLAKYREKGGFGTVLAWRQPDE